MTWGRFRHRCSSDLGPSRLSHTQLQMESGQESLAQLPAPLDQFGCDQSCVCRSMVLPITCWTVTCGGAPRIVACSSNWQWPDRVGVSGFGPQGHIAHKQYKVLQNCDLPLLYVHPSNCSHILLSSIRGHQKIQWPWHHKAGLPQNTRDSWHCARVASESHHGSV